MKKIGIAIIILFINFNLFEDNIIIKLIPLFLFCSVIFDEMIVKKTNLTLYHKTFCSVNILILLVLVGVLISKRVDVSISFKILKVITFLTFYIAFLSTVFNESKKKTFLDIFVFYVYIPITIYIFLNLLLFFLGIQDVSHEIGEGVILSYFGVIVQRVQFVLALGVNGYGVLVGAIFNISLIGLFVIKKSKKVFVIGLIITLITLLLTDSRGPIVYSIGIFLLIKFVYFKIEKPKFLWLIPFIGFLGPILMISTLTFLSQTEYGALLSRSSDDLSTGNSRLVIWTIAGSEFLSFKPEHHIFGYGEFGQYAAGLSQQWAFIFGDIDGVEYMHPHNTFLSIALDYGYFGVIIFTISQFFIVRVIKENWSTNKLISCILLANILYFNLVGIGETMFGFYYRNIIYVFFMINIFAFVVEYCNTIYKKKRRYV